MTHRHAALLLLLLMWTVGFAGASKGFCNKECINILGHELKQATNDTCICDAIDRCINATAGGRICDFCPPIPITVTTRACTLAERNATCPTTPRLKTALRVFVTRGRTNGAFGGTAGGDAICQAEADAAGLNASFIAYISIEATQVGALERLISHLAFPERIVPIRRVDGNSIETAVAELGVCDPNCLTLAVSLDANGVAVPTGLGGTTWTGSDGGGDALPPATDKSCNDWTSASASEFANVGFSDFISTGWEAGGEKECDTLNRLYCFETGGEPFDCCVTEVCGGGSPCSTTLSCS